MYKIIINNKAVKDFKRISDPYYEKIKQEMVALSLNPFPADKKCKPLKGKHIGSFRIRVGDYRVLYTVDHELKSIIIYAALHRREAYLLF